MYLHKAANIEIPSTNIAKILSQKHFKVLSFCIASSFSEYDCDSLIDEINQQTILSTLRVHLKGLSKIAYQKLINAINQLKSVRELTILHDHFTYDSMYDGTLLEAGKPLKVELKLMDLTYLSKALTRCEFMFFKIIRINEAFKLYNAAL